MRSFFWGKKRDQVWWKKDGSPDPVTARFQSIEQTLAYLKRQGDETMASLKDILARTQAATKAMEERYAKQAGDLTIALDELADLRAAFDAFKAEVADFAEGVASDAADEEKIGAPVVGSTDGIER